MADSALKSNPDNPEAQETTENAGAFKQLQDEVEKLQRAAEYHRQDAATAKTYVTALLARMEEESRKGETKVDPEEAADRFLEAFKTNPTAALESVVEQHWRARMGPILTEHLATQASLMKDKAIQKVGEKKWAKYSDETEAFMAGMSPETQAKPGAWEEAFRYIQARHIDEEVEERLKAKLNNEEEAMLEGPSPSRGRITPKSPLSPDEQRIAKEFGMSTEEWNKNKASYERWDKRG